MHLTRASTSKRIPIPRKGTVYVARTFGYTDDSVSVLVAVRDMLKLARTAKEVNEMIKAKQLKLNGSIVRNYREAIRLFNFLEAHKKYKLTLLPTGRFTLVETKETTRFAKVINKKLQKKGLVQLNLHDGTNLLTREKVSVGDSIELDNSNKIVKVLPLAKAKHVFIYKGKNGGHEATVEKVHEGRVQLKVGGRSVSLEAGQVIAL